MKFGVLVAALLAYAESTYTSNPFALDSNIVFGNKNTVGGLRDTVYGNLNDVYGIGLNIKGDANKVKGLDSTIIGNYNNLIKGR